MSTNDIRRAWKDSRYRESLSEEQRALLPSNPIGEALSEQELQAITGAGMIGTNLLSSEVDACPPTQGLLDCFTLIAGCLLQ